MNIIGIDLDKCVGCNSCVRVCPTPGTNVAEYDHNGNMVIDIDSDKCIKCGACIKACTHKARFYRDDTERFINDVLNGKDIIIITAPAIKIAFDGNWRHVLQWFRNKGIKEIYDVSLGADICTWAHIKYLNENKGKKIISQPCAAIVNYIVQHKPELIRSLSPVHSPMLCLAVYIRKYLDKTCKIAAFSPCIAKKEEFEQTGYIDYNVTFKHLKEYFEKNNVDLPKIKIYSEFEFDGTPGFVGSIYPKPGGLKENILLHAPDVHVLNSEGVRKVYREIDDYAKEDKQNIPTVFDVLNCEFGCNDGPAIGQSYKPFKMEAIMRDVKNYTVKARNDTVQTEDNGDMTEDMQFREFDEKLRLKDFLREYNSKYIESRVVSEKEIQDAFAILDKKTTIEKNFDCHACGFMSCREMAAAIAMGINTPDNCHQYIMGKIKKESIQIERVNKTVIDIMEELKNMFAVLIKSVADTTKESENISILGKKNVEDMTIVNEYMKELGDLVGDIYSNIDGIKKDVRNYKKVTDDVEQISQNINLLSFNASIEAARAGELGKGFSVIANNIRELSENSRKSVQNATSNNKNINESIVYINKVIDNFIERIKELMDVVESTIKDVKNTSENGMRINDSMTNVTELSGKINNLIERTRNVLQNNNYK